MIRIATAFLALTAGGLVLMADDLKAQSDPAAIVKERQDLMRQSGGSFGPMVAVVQGQSTDLTAATAAAETMSTAFSKSATLFPAGTAQGEVAGSRARPEVWTESAAFQAAAQALIDASAQLAALGSAVDLDGFKAQFGQVAQACGGCHLGHGSAGGKFRFPK